MTNRGTSFGGQIIATSEQGDVTVELIGDLVTSQFPGSGIEAESRIGDVTIRMRGNVVENGLTIAQSTRAPADLEATAGVGDVLIDYVGDVGGTLTGLTENGTVTINSAGNLTSNVSGPVIRARTGTDSSSATSTLPGGDITITSVGDITSIAASSTGLISGTLGSGANGDITIVSTGDLIATGFTNAAGIDGSTTYQLLNGVETGHGDIRITSTGDITLTAAQSTGIRGVVGTNAQSGGDGDVTIRSVGNITMGGADSIGIHARVSAGHVSDITVSGGVVSGGGGTGSGISFGANLVVQPGFVGTFLGSEAGSTNRVTIAADGTVGAASGLAIRGSDGNEEILVDGRIDGRVELGNGADRVTLRPGGVLAGTVDFGDGSDTIIVDAANGTTGNLALFSNGTAFATGLETIEKRGEGTWVFAGGDFPAGAPQSTARILEGTAAFNANLFSIYTFVSTGARLIGTGGSGNLTNNGVFAPGASIGAFTVNGNLALNAPGTLEIEIASDNTADRIDVTGTTVLGGTLRVLGQGLLTAFSTSNVYQVIESAGGISGTFASIVDNLPDLDIVVSIVNGGRTLQLGLADPTVQPVTGCNPPTVANGGTVICTGVDPDGFQSASTNVDLTVEAAATVTSNAAGASPLALGDNGRIVNRGTVNAGPAGTAIQAATGDQTNVVNEGVVRNRQPGQDGVTGIAAAGTITNRSTIDVEGANGVTGVRAEAGGTASNFGTISVSSTGDGAALRGSGADVILRNETAGTIELTGAGSGIVADSGARAINNGTVRVASGQGVGVRLTGQGNAQSFVNASVIESAGAAAVASSAQDAALDNSGELRATAADSAGVVFEAATGNRLDNRSLVQGGASGVNFVGPTTGAAPTLVIDNEAAGVIRATAAGGAGVLVENGVLQLINAGRIEGGAGGRAVRLDVGADQVTLRNGSEVLGGVDLGAGDDRLTFEAGASLFGGTDFGPGNDTLELVAAVGQTASFDLSENSAGLDSLITRGPGTWEFTGGDLDAGGAPIAAQLNAGASRFTANLRSLQTTVGANARLSGTGGSGALVNNGVFAPGASIGTFQVTGDLTLNAPGVLEIEIAPDNTSDRVNVSGATQLAGRLEVQALGMQTAFSNANVYRAIQSDGGITGTFDTVTDPLADLDVSVQIVDNGRGLQLSLVSPVSPGGTSDKTVIPNALHGVAEGARNFSLALSDRAMTAGPANERLYWLTGLLSRDERAQMTDRDTRFETAGFALGVDQDIRTDLGGDLVLGFAVGGTEVDVARGPSSARTESWHWGGYAQYDLGPLRLQGAASIGGANVNLTREIAIPNANPAIAQGRTDALTTTTSLTISHDIASTFDWGGEERLRIAPLLRIGHVAARLDSYRESGAGILNLEVDRASLDQTWLGVGLQASALVKTGGDIVFRPDFELRYDHVIGDRNAVVDSSIARVVGVDFTTQGAPIARSQVTLGAGLAIDFDDGLSMRAGYSGTFAEDNDQHLAEVTLSFRY